MISSKYMHRLEDVGQPTARPMHGRLGGSWLWLCILPLRPLTLQQNMQAVRLCARRRVCRLAPDFPRRALSSSSGSSPSTSAPGPIPWFLDPSDVPASSAAHTSKPHAPRPLVQQPSLPAEIPSDSPIASLYAALCTSPHLESGTLKVGRPIPSAMGPPLLDSPAKGRRKRGRTYAGEGVHDHAGDIWDWVVLAQASNDSSL